MTSRIDAVYPPRQPEFEEPKHPGREIEPPHEDPIEPHRPPPDPSEPVQTPPDRPDDSPVRIES